MKPNARIRIGNQTAFSAADLLAPFHYAIHHGFDAFEWFPDKKGLAGWDIADLTGEQRCFIREAGQRHGLALSMHAPWWANPLDAAVHNLLLTHIAFSTEVGAILFNIHFHGGQGIEAYVKAIMPLVAATAQAGIKLAIENTVETTAAECNRLFALLAAELGPAGAEHPGLCLDIGHANLSAATRNDYLGFVDQLSSQVPIIHLHLHENYGDHDSHLPLFTGPAGSNDAGIRGLLGRLKMRGFNGAMILEQWPEPPALLNTARDRLLAMLESGGEGPKTDTGQAMPQTRPQAGPARPGATSSQPGPAGPSPAIRSGQPAAAKARRVESVQDYEQQNFLEGLVAMDQASRSFREKLAGLLQLLQHWPSALLPAQLACLAIYLRFLGTGELQCAEDGRHFRPSHHARLAQQILQRLSALTTAGRNDFLLRRIEPWLPSYDSAFVRAEPLTRIRDIAHRNDIPRELKKEIKETLQNKLHRCAGPEDLATSAALLQKITVPGAGYSPAFVEEFSLFHGELLEFFNASPLRERLAAMLAREQIEPAALVQRWLAAKAKPRYSIREQLARLHLATELRRRLRLPAGKRTEQTARDLRMVDIGLEDHVFVLLSSLENNLVADGRFAGWPAVLSVMVEAIANMGLSAIEPHECLAIAADLAGWQKQLAPDSKDWLLLVKASLDRCQRLADAFTDRVLNLFADQAERLGTTLEVAGPAVRVYVESELRGHLVFQVAKLSSLLLRRIRPAAGLPAWEVLVPGTASGRLVEAGQLGDLAASAAQGEQMVVLLAVAEGDEEIPRGVAAILLCHELPRLSHLAVRARQAGVVFVAYEDRAEVALPRGHLGETVRVEAAAGTLAIEPASAGRAEKIIPGAIAEIQVTVPEPASFSGRRLLELTEVTTANSGAKADGARRLAELARHSAAGFKTPPAVVVPFGVMEEALQTAPAGLEKQYHELVARLTDGGHSDFCRIVGQLRSLTEGLAVHQSIVEGVAARFGADRRLIIRSSANCEDLREMAAAGLYDSVANVRAEGGGLEAALRRVWGSLWGPRATASRVLAGIPHHQACMAVIIQELIVPDYSFVIHTINPINHNRDELYMELAVGLGESIASGAVRGCPFRLVCNLRTSDVQMLAAASFSSALWPEEAGGGLLARPVSYADQAFSTWAELRQDLGRRLATVGRLVEEAAGSPQDIEGVMVGADIYLVQTRPQQGLQP